MIPGQLEITNVSIILSIDMKKHFHLRTYFDRARVFGFIVAFIIIFYIGYILLALL